MEALNRILPFTGTEQNRGLLKHRNILQRLRECQSDSTKELRALSYRVLGRLVQDSPSQHFQSFHFDVFVIRYFEIFRQIPDSRCTLRWRANRSSRLYPLNHQLSQGFLIDLINKVRKWFQSVLYAFLSVLQITPQINSATLPSKHYVSLVNIQSKSALRNPSVVAYTGGLQSAFAAVVEGREDLLPIVIQTFLFLIDSPKTCVFIRPNVELEVLKSPFDLI